MGGLLKLNGDTWVQAAHGLFTPAITEANGQSGHGLPLHRALPNLTGAIGLSGITAVTALRRGFRLRRVTVGLAVTLGRVRLVVHGL
ncbi:hypothetical protein ID853_18390 [Xenorhabdus sp. Vera]|nr:hypothetical protein [Xenorhabdus sp. Vera]